MAAGFACVANDGSVKRQRIDVACNYRAEMMAQIETAKSNGFRRIALVFDASSPVAVLLRFARSGAGARGQILLRGLIDEWWAALQSFEVVVFLWQKSHSENEPANEWADEEADAAAAEPMDDDAATDGMARQPTSYSSMEMVGVEKGLRRWAMRRASKLVIDVLQATSVSTQVIEAGDVNVSSGLHGAARRAAFAVLGGRCQMGDVRKFPSRRLRMTTSDCVCPHGCTAQSGARARFTWFHVQFDCQCPEVRGMRREWVEASEELEGCFETGKADRPSGWMLQEAWQQARLRGARSLGETIGGARPDEAVCQEAWLEEIVERGDDDLQLRRVVGGALNGRGLRKGRREQAVYGKVVGLGLQLQLWGWQETAELEKAAREATAHERLMKPYWGRWRETAAAGGPRRAAALAEVRRGVREVARVSAGGTGQGVLAGWLVVEEARVKAMRLPFWGLARAAELWRLLEGLTGWRLACLRRRLDEGVEEQVSGVVGEVRRAMGASTLCCGDWRGVDRRGTSSSAEATDEGLTPLAVTLRWACGIRRGPCAARAVNAARAEDVRSGRAAGRGDMWRLESIRDVAIPAKRKGRQLNVQVQWEGRWGEQQREWVPVTWLNAAARKEARALELARWPVGRAGGARGRGGVEADEVAGAATVEETRRRKSPRVAGVVPDGGLS